MMTDRNDFSSGIREKETAGRADASSRIKASDGSFVTEECPQGTVCRRSDVQYAEPVHVTYYSKTCGMERGANVLLPSGYTTEKKYPVLYMLHGIFGDENSFISDPANGMTTLWTNAAADGEAPEMIVVFPNMYAKTKENQAPGFTAEACAPYDNFVNDLADDLMPFIEANYSVLTGRKNTAVAGFSMGGRETLYISLMKPGLFGFACAISPAPGLVPGKDRFMEHPGSLREDEVSFTDESCVPEILILCGTQDSVVGTFPKSYHELMEKNGVPHAWYEVQGSDHDNRTILSGVYNFIQRVFK